MKNYTVFKNWKEDPLSDPEVKKEYDRLLPKEMVVREIIKARMKEEMRPEDLAKKG